MVVTMSPASSSPTPTAMSSAKWKLMNIRPTLLTLPLWYSRSLLMIFSRKIWKLSFIYSEVSERFDGENDNLVLKKGCYVLSMLEINCIQLFIDSTLWTWFLIVSASICLAATTALRSSSSRSVSSFLIKAADCVFSKQWLSWKEGYSLTWLKPMVWREYRLSIWILLILHCIRNIFCTCLLFSYLSFVKTLCKIRFDSII